MRLQFGPRNRGIDTTAHFVLQNTYYVVAAHYVLPRDAAFAIFASVLQQCAKRGLISFPSSVFPRLSGRGSPAPVHRG